VTAVLAAMRPGWTIFLGESVIVVSIAVIVVTLQLWTHEAEIGGCGPGHQGDYGGGGRRRRRPDAPQHGGGGSDPSWWPEFERQLAFSLEEAETNRQVAVRQAEPARHAVTRIPV
jgi:hypothetical protein